MSRQIPDIAASLLGSSPDDDSVAWASANPVAPAFTSQFAQALEDAGHRTTVQMVPGADHQTIYQADVVSDRIAPWLLALPGASDEPRS